MEEVTTYTIAYRVHKSPKVLHERRVTREAVQEFQRKALDSEHFAWFYIEREGGAPFKGQDRQEDDAR